MRRERTKKRWEHPADYHFTQTNWKRARKKLAVEREKELQRNAICEFSSCSSLYSPCFVRALLVVSKGGNVYIIKTPTDTFNLKVVRRETNAKTCNFHLLAFCITSLLIQREKRSVKVYDESLLLLLMSTGNMALEMVSYACVLKQASEPILVWVTAWFFIPFVLSLGDTSWHERCVERETTKADPTKGLNRCERAEV